MVVVQRRVVVSRRRVAHDGGTKEEEATHLWIQETLRHLPLILVALAACMLHVLCLTHNVYVEPYLQSLRWTGPANAKTYEFFTCHAQDITARRPEPLMIPLDTSTGAAVDSMRHHGMGIFPGVLNATVADDLRQYVLWKNQHITAMENIPVIEYKYRASLGLDVTDHVVIRTALTQLASHTLLSETMAALLGLNPAMVELSTITSSAGAAAQYFHSDSTFAGSASVYGKSFSEAYSILIPLQDTVKEQGATWVCPGTHRCSQAGAACRQLGFQVTSTTSTAAAANRSRQTDAEEDAAVTDDAYFAAGDALVYSSSATHRGGAHLGGPDRVVLIVTVASRPDAVRLLPLGLVYAIRWDHWGFCWQDLLDLQVWEVPFWNQLRALGVFKLSGDWGWTYLESSALRMMNDMFYFSYADLNAFRNARLNWLGQLPGFLQGRVEEAADYAPWPRYLSDVVSNLWWALVTVGVLVVAAYTLFAAREGPGSLRREFSAHVCIAGFVVGCGFFLWWLVASSRHAQIVVSGDFRHGLAASFALPNATGQKRYGESQSTPGYRDVLISDRLLEQSGISSQSRLLDYHPANRRWKIACRDAVKLWMAYKIGLPPAFSTAVVDKIVKEATEEGRRHFFRSNRSGGWVRLSRNEAHRETEQQLVGGWSMSKVSGAYTTKPTGLCRVLSAGPTLLDQAGRSTSTAAPSLPVAVFRPHVFVGQPLTSGVSHSGRQLQTQNNRPSY